MRVIPRTTSNAGSGERHPTDSPAASTHSDTVSRIVLPIVLILVIAALATLFALYCRRVLHRSRLAGRPVRLGLFGRQTRPELWDVHLGRPEDRAIPLRDMRVSVI